MAEKVARTGIERNDKSYIYFIKDGAVWRVPRKQPGVPKGKREKVVDAGIEMESAYIYFLDKEGDIARSKRAIGGQKRKKKAKKKVAKKKVAKKKAKKKVAKKKAKKKVAKKKVAKKKAKKKAAKKTVAKKAKKGKKGKKGKKVKKAKKAKKAKKK